MKGSIGSKMVKGTAYSSLLLGLSTLVLMAGNQRSQWDNIGCMLGPMCGMYR